MSAAASAMELFAVLSHEDLAGKPVLLVLNKTCGAARRRVAPAPLA